MVDSQKLKIPLGEIQAYLEEQDKYKSQILSLIKLEVDGVFSKTEIEERLPVPFMKIQDCMTTICKKNNLNQSSQLDHDKKLLNLFSEQINKIQKDCLSIKADQHDVPLILRDMKKSLEQSLGQNMEIEINRVVDNFNGMLMSFESHFQELKDKLQSLEDKFDQNIKSLQNQLQQKELQIQEYKVKDGQVDILREVVEDYNQRADNAFNSTNNCQHQANIPESSHQDSDEEEKKSNRNSGHQDQPQPPSKYPHLPFFDMPDVSKIKNDGTMQFKKDKYSVPFGYEWTVEGEWLNGVPHGVCIVESKNDRGVCTYTHGKQHGVPSWFEEKDSGARYSYEYSDYIEAKSVYRVYYSDTKKCNVSSTHHQTPTPGWLRQITFERDKSSGFDKELYFLQDGTINYGWFKYGNLMNGFEWQLKDDGTYDKFSVQCVKFGDEEKKTFICNEKQYVLKKDIN